MTNTAPGAVYAAPPNNPTPSAKDMIAAATGESSSDWDSPELSGNNNSMDGGIESSPEEVKAAWEMPDEAEVATTEQSSATEETPVSTETPAAASAANTEEEVEVAPDTRVKVNFADKNSITEYIKKAVAADSALKDKEALLVEKNALEARMRELESEFELLEDAMDVDGIAGLVNKLAKDETAYSKWFAAEVEKEIAYRNATPEGKAAIDAQRKAEALERKLAAQGKKNERLSKKEAALAEKRQAEAAAAERARVTNMAHSLFKKHSFAGKTDADAAKAIDTAIWGNAMTELASMPKGTQVTEQLLAGLFEKHSKVFAKTITASTEKVIEQKKADARGALDTAASNAKGQPSSSKQEFLKAQSGGTMADRLKAAAKLLRGG